MAVERTHPAPCREARLPATRTGEAIDLPADQMPEGVTAEGVARQQHHVDEHDEGADADTELARPRAHRAVSEDAAYRPARGEEHVVGEYEDEDYCRVHEIAVHILENERKPGLALVAVPRLADAAGHGVKEEGAVVGFAVVVAGGAESARGNEDQKGGRQRPPRRLDPRPAERPEIQSPFLRPLDPGPPRRAH